MQTTDYTRWFRGSTPYISAHRNKTFVILLTGAAFEHNNLTNIVHDIALLHVLGVRIVLVYGARPQIEAQFDTQKYHRNRRITRKADMEKITGVHGQLRAKLEALFSTGLPNTPLHNVDVPVVSGNFVTAQPVGVIDGMDHLFTGQVRSVEHERINRVLETGGLLLQAPIGYSPSGQAFNLNAEELAAQIAVKINADKLISLDALSYIADEAGQRISTFTPTELEQRIEKDRSDQRHRIDCLIRAVRGGVAKSHLIGFADDGALLAELFTAEGVGTQIVERARKPVRTARLEDVSGIVEVIRPLEESGALVRRERYRLEQEISYFLVAELDGIVVGCCAIYPYGTKAELACVAVHENYRAQSGAGIGSSLLEAAENKARARGISELFVLTTQTRDWFLEQGFEDSNIDALPVERQELYNWQRNSKVMCKTLSP